MRDIDHQKTDHLLTCFFKECERAFRFLEEQHGYFYYKGIIDRDNHSKKLTPYKNFSQTPGLPFYAVTRYERGHEAIEIFYGDNDYALEVFIYPDYVQRVSVNNLISAAGASLLSPDFSYLKGESELCKGIQALAAILRDQPAVLNPDEEMVRQACSVREKLLEEAVRAHHESLSKAAHVEIS